MRPVSELINAVRTSFWFMPAALGMFGAMLASLALAYDGWIAATGDGERLLSTLAGAVITVTGVVFSLTVVTLHLASGQFGPRLLRTFMRDRANQTVLGIFVATFVYCVLAILGEPSGAGLAVWVGVVLTGASVAALIFFIHHLATAIQADKVGDDLSKQIGEQVDRLFPDDAEPAPVPQAPVGAQTICAPRDGYVLSINLEGLLAAATEAEASVQVLVRPGRFVTAGSPVMLAWPAAPEDVVEHVSIGAVRTENDDIEFSIQQLAEMATRALSPSINDPFTAMMCIDWLSATYCRLAPRSTAPIVREGRVIVPRPSFRQMLDAGFGCIRQHAHTPMAQARLLEGMARVALSCRSPSRRAAVREQALAVLAQAENDPHTAGDMAHLHQVFRVVTGQLEVATR